MIGNKQWKYAALTIMGRHFEGIFDVLTISGADKQLL